jgi:formylglycine-generating enzyme required for sulfatase activity
MADTVDAVDTIDTIDLAEMTRTRRHDAEPETILIPAGAFLMGSDPLRDPHARDDELPQHSVDLPDYAIGRTPVTNAQYAAFLKATRHDPPSHWRLLFWKRRWPPLGKADYPVVNVTWYDARAHCRWLSEVTGKPFRLPNEPEWEKAARGEDGRIYPWGDTWEEQRCNIELKPDAGAPTPVDAFPEGASAFGALDMIGNVWEWTRSLWGHSRFKPEYGYPYDPHDGRENQAASQVVRRVLRGVSFYNQPHDARCAARYRYSPRNRFNSVGFRVVISPSAAERPEV